jgi:rod shape-determining protein MreD
LRRPHEWDSWLFTAIGAALQALLFSRFIFAGARPDVVTAVAMSYGLLLGPAGGFWSGFAAGLMIDLMNSRFVGLYAITRGMVGLIAGFAGGKVFKENLLMTGLLAGGCSFLADMVGALIIRSTGVAFDLALFARVALYAGFMNLVLTPVVFMVLWRRKVSLDSQRSAVIIE